MAEEKTGVRKKTKVQPKSKDAQQLADKYNITYNPTGYVDASDPMVWDGKKKRPASQVAADFYKLDEGQLEGFQRGAYQAGLYGKGVTPRFGDYDDDSFRIWDSLVDRSAGFLASKKKVSPVDALGMAISVGIGPNVKDAPDPPLATNPADFAALANKVGQEGLGYELDAGQQSQVAGQLAAEERPYLTAHGTTAAPGSGAVQASAREKVRALDPTRFDARKVVSAFDVIQRALAGGN